MSLPANLRAYLAAIGRKGGRSRSPAKVAAGRKNAAKATRVRLAKRKVTES